MQAIGLVVFLRVPHDIVTDSRLTSTDLRVLLAIATFADIATGANCRPAAKTIAAAANLSERAVRSSIDRLTSLGLVVLTHRVSDVGATLPPFYVFPWFSGTANPAPTPAPFAGGSLHRLQGEPAPFAANQEPLNQEPPTKNDAVASSSLADAPATQLALTMQTTKPKRDPPPRVQAALAAQVEWNATMVPPNARSSRLDGADVTVVGNAVEYVGGIDAMRDLIRWAVSDDWFGGRATNNPWTIRSWCAKNTIDAAIAKRSRGPAAPVRPPPKFGSIAHLDQINRDERARNAGRPIDDDRDVVIPF